MGGTAIIGALILDLQKRLTTKQQMIAGILLLPLGWIILLAMSGSGPFPMKSGVATGMGILLTAIILLLLPALRAFRLRHRGRFDPKA
ncbi:MAG: hypothetical protein QM690_13130 [Sphingobium sp.]